MLNSKKNGITLVLLAGVLLVSGCQSTQDLDADDKSAPSLILNASKSISDRTTISAEYSTVNAESTQTVEGREVESDVFGDSRAVQINGQRFVATPANPVQLNYDYSLDTFKLEVGYDVIQGDIYQLNIAPGLMHYSYDLDVLVEGQQFRIKDNEIGAGLAMTNSFNLREKLTFDFGFGVYFYDESPLLTSRVAFNYQFHENFNASLGFRSTNISDISTSNNDSCFGDEPAEQCENSDVDISAQGFFLGFKYAF